jgi:hypothetical protein
VITVQHHRADLGRGELLVVDADLHGLLRTADDLEGNGLLLGADFLVPPPHEALDRHDRALGVHDGLALRGLADQALAGLGERHHGRGCPAALRVVDHDGLAALEDGHDRVGRA